MAAELLYEEVLLVAAVMTQGISFFVLFCFFKNKRLCLYKCHRGNTRLHREMDFIQWPTIQLWSQIPAPGLEKEANTETCFHSRGNSPWMGVFYAYLI